MFPRSLVLLSVLLCACSPVPELAQTQRPIVGGQVVSTCQWPTAVALSLDGCSATLVHPRLVTTAAHCIAAGSSGSIRFGETRSGGRTIPVQCTASNEGDIAFWVLDQEVTDVPIVPGLIGCETDILRRGQSVTLVGYGSTSSGGPGFGTKRSVDVMVNSVGSDYVDLGTPQIGACHGDSGGPAYVKLADGTWRVFGATSGPGFPGDDCASSTIYTLITHYVPWIEQTSGIDITPCTDANGTWNPGPGCTHFPMNPDQGGGSWSSGCANTTAFSGPSTTCGAGISVDAGTTVDAGFPDASGSGGSGGSGGGGNGGSSGAGGSGGGSPPGSG